jgi:hypothetical protein
MIEIVYTISIARYVFIPDHVETPKIPNESTPDQDIRSDDGYELHDSSAGWLLHFFLFIVFDLHLPRFSHPLSADPPK